MTMFKGDFLDSQSEELERLSSISDIIHLKENNLAFLFRNNKYNLKCSLYSFELFIAFLTDNRLGFVRKIVNQFINVIGKL
jgi:transcription initiation factor TFIID subunit 5